jgi:S1-C subfamily serine protease
MSSLAMRWTLLGLASLLALVVIVAPKPVGAPGVESGPLSAADTRRLITATTVRVVGFGASAVQSGSGVACASGVTVTSRHVVEGSAAVNVAPHEGPVALGPVELSGDADVAVVRTQLQTGESVRLADHDPGRGQQVTIAGYPVGGSSLEMHEAQVVDYVEGRYRDERDTVMRVTLNPRPGMSGGPVFDTSGRLVGLVYASEGQSGYGLAIPVSRLRNVLNGSGDLSAIACS